MFSISPSGTIRTKSPLVAWYLQVFCGREIRSRWREPQGIFFGTVLYKTRWVLVPAN